MTTASDLIQETKRYLFSGHREPLNLLSGSHNNSTTTFTFAKSISAITAGSYLSVDLEIVYVWDTNESAGTATVQRGMLGSVAATHADQAVVTVNSRFPDFSIFQALNADLDDLSATSNGLFKVAEVTLSYNAARQGYDLTSVDSTKIINVLRVRHETPGPAQSWPEIRQWQLKYQQDTSIFPSGMSLVLYEPGWPGLDVRVTYSSTFTHFSTTADDATSVAGLASTMYDIPPLGAAARLSGFREVARNFTESQSDPRRATEVPPNAQLAGATALLRLRAQRIKAESIRLANQYPARRMV